MRWVSVLGIGVCSTDPAMREASPIPCPEPDRNTVPPVLRRRSSEATVMAFSAATAACTDAGRDPAGLQTVFASVGGEIQITDTLCIELAKPDGVVSPTAFHNAVHNTAAGYWSIARGAKEQATAMAGGFDTFAMGVIESWSRLATRGGELLLICHDERWPDYLAAPVGEIGFAAAFVLSADPDASVHGRFSRPTQSTGTHHGPIPHFIEQAPITAAVPLLHAIAERRPNPAVIISPVGGWTVAFEPPSEHRA